MNAFFSTLARRLRDTAGKRGAAIEEPDLEPAVADELLQLARVVAHRGERSFAPLASYMAGIAVERLRRAHPNADAAAYVREVREALEVQHDD